MKTSSIFYGGAYKELELEIARFINGQADFLSARTAGSPRAAGDAIQDLLAENFQTIGGKHIGAYSSIFARRAMADLAFTDPDGFYCVVDVKTHRLDTKFNMPNLTSVERLARFYEDDNNYFVLLTVAYLLEGTHISVKTVHFVPIEFLSWDCLTIGALGWGQIQIANSNNITIVEKNSRKKWMIDLCNTVLEFYPAEIAKIGDRIKHFQKVKERWEKKSG